MLFYKGTKTSGYIQPRDLSNYDIVVTTYSILQSETNYVDLPHSNSEEGEFLKPKNKEIQIILRLFLVIAMYCQASSSQLFSIIHPLTLLAGWKGSLGTCSR